MCASEEEPGPSGGGVGGDIGSCAAPSGIGMGSGIGSSLSGGITGGWDWDDNLQDVGSTIMQTGTTGMAIGAAAAVMDGPLPFGEAVLMVSSGLTLTGAATYGVGLAGSYMEGFYFSP